ALEDAPAIRDPASLPKDDLWTDARVTCHRSLYTYHHRRLDVIAGAPRSLVRCGGMYAVLECDPSGCDTTAEDIHIGFPIPARGTEIRPIALYHIAVKPPGAGQKLWIDVRRECCDALDGDSVEHRRIKDLHSCEYRIDEGT